MFLAPLLMQPSAGHVLRRRRDHTILASQLEPAFDSQARNKGLLGRSGLAPGSAMILAPCFTIHTVGMRFPIDVVFAARDGRVLKTYPHLRAWRAAFAFGAFTAIELPAGAIGSVGLVPGEVLELAST